MNEDLSQDDPQVPETGEESVVSAAGETLSHEDASDVKDATGSQDVNESPAPVEDAREGSPETAPEIAPEIAEPVAEVTDPVAETPEAPAEAPEPEEEETAPTWVPEPDKLLCALLFASHEYLNARALREIMGEEWDTPRLRQLVKKINRDLESGEMAFEVLEVEGTFRIRTRPEYFPWTRKLFKDSTPRRLSQAALETLAIVAYKQPITKAEIESIRGVNVDGSLKTLLDKRLVDIGRRSDSLGQAFTYHTTRDFLRYFGINRMPDDLPRLSEFEGILNAQSLIPQMGTDGEVHEVVRSEEPEQLSLGMGSASEPEE